MACLFSSRFAAMVNMTSSEIRANGSAIWFMSAVTDLSSNYQPEKLDLAIFNVSNWNKAIISS